MVKNLINDSFNLSFERVLEKERDGLGKCGMHPEGIESINTFLERKNLTSVNKINLSDIKEFFGFSPGVKSFSVWNL